MSRIHTQHKVGVV